jgi:hypothetical protein
VEATNHKGEKTKDYRESNLAQDAKMIQFG